MSKIHIIAALCACLLLSSTVPKSLCEVVDEDEYEDVIIDEEDEPSEPEVSSGDVVVLTQGNFDETIEKHPYVLVEFYAPWCGHCQKLEPEYAKAATQMKSISEDVVLAKVDATVEEDLAARFEISGFPTIKWFDHQEDSEYTGGREVDSIVNWIRKKIGPATTKIETKELLAELEKTTEVVVVGYFQKLQGEDYEEFVQVAKANEEVAFVETNVKEVAEAAGLKKAPGISIITNFEGEERDVDVLDKEITVDNLEQFILEEKLPDILNFEMKNQGKIFDSGIPLQILFIGKNEDFEEKADFFKLMKSVTGKYKGKLIIVTVYTDDEIASSVTEFFNLKPEDLPAIIGFHVDSGKKYVYKNDLKADKLKDWTEKFIKGEMEPDYKSEDIPEDDKDSGVQVVVGKTFDTIVKNPKKDVLLEIYAPWCGHCKSLEPIYKKLAKRFAEIESVVIAKMDGTANEHKEITVSGFPTLLFYAAEENATGIIYDSGDRTLKDLTKFIKSHAKIPYELKKKGKEGEAASPDAKTEL